MNFEEFEREQTGKPAKEQEAQEVNEVQEAFTPEAAQVYIDTEEDGQRVIRIKPREYDSALDPERLEFDREKYEQFKEQEVKRLNAAMAALNRMSATIADAADSSLNALVSAMKSETWQGMRETLEAVAAAFPLLQEIKQLAPYLEAELQNSKYQGKTIDELLEEAETDEDGNPLTSSLFMQALTAARAVRAIEAQKTGREIRRQMKENAMNSGAIMDLQKESLVSFSDKDLWDAFAPGRISRIGTLAPEMIDKETGRIKKYELDKGEIMPVTAMEISYKAFLLLNTILANSVENYREDFVKDGTIKFYVKGVLDGLDIDPRIKNDGQLDINRKTAGVLYLEREFAPLLSFIGTIPGGSRYSVFNYEGYDANTDTMIIRLPYLFQLWKATQAAYFNRQIAKEERIKEGKKPLKKDLTPLKVNALFKTVAYKEDDAVLEIATYITNVLLNAGKGSHETKISFKTIIKNSPRLREKLRDIEEIPNSEKQENGKPINKTARYNSELRKIARAYSLIMNPDRCDALKYFSFEEVRPTKEENKVFIPPTKSTLDGEIYIKWRRINNEDD